MGDDLEALIATSALTSTPMAPALGTSPDSPGALAAAAPTAQAGVSGTVPGTTVSHNSSVVEHVRSRLRTFGMMALWGIVVLAAGSWFILGHSGRQQVRSLLASRIEGQPAAAAGAPDQTPPKEDDGIVTVPLALEETGDGKTIYDMDFVHDVAGTIDWYAFRGDWEHDPGALVYDVFEDGKGLAQAARTPRAFLAAKNFRADGFRIEASVHIADQPPGDANISAQRTDELVKQLSIRAVDTPPAAKLYLYRNKRQFFTVVATAGDDGGYNVVWNLGDGHHYGTFSGGSDLPPPKLGSDLHLALWIEGKTIHASVDGKEIGSADVGRLPKFFAGRAGIGCVDAVCTFTRVRVEGKLRTPGDHKQQAQVQTGGLEPMAP